MRIDHTNCSHPRTPAGRADCRRSNNRVAAGIESPADAPENQGVYVPTREERILTAAENMRKANAKVTVVTRVEDLPIPKLTPAQLASPVFQSLLRKRRS